MQYVPLWTSILDSPKLMKLEPEVFRFWAMTLLCAQKWDFVEGMLPDVERIAHWLRMDEDECRRLMSSMLTSGLIEPAGDGWKIHDWNDWRNVSDPKAAQRMRKSREAKRNGLRDGHAPVTDVLRPRYGPVTGVFGDVTTNPNPNPNPNPKQATRPPACEAPQEIVPMRKASSEWEPNPMPDESMTGRTGQDHADLIRAIDILDGHETTRRLGSELRMYVDTPAMRNIHGWQMIVAAMTAQRPDKGKTWGSLMAFARNATQSEFDKLNAQAPARIAASSIPTLSDEQLRAQTEEANRKVAEYRRKQAHS